MVITVNGEPAADIVPHGERVAGWPTIGFAASFATVPPTRRSVRLDALAVQTVSWL